MGCATRKCSSHRELEAKAVQESFQLGEAVMEIEHINENNDLDPRLQVTFDRLSRQTLQTATNSDSLGEIAVVAVVNDPSVWADRTDFRMIAELGKTRDGQHTIVTARVPASRIPDIRNDKRVVSLKGAQQIPMALKATVPDILATPAVLPTRANSRLGEGVVLGIIDYGCDFAHRNFRNSNGTTRIEALWDQSPGLQAMGDVQYGRVYSKSAIDSALKSKQPYDVLGYDPDPARLGMHGTHVMDIAAGNGAGSGIPGVAPKTTIVFVQTTFRGWEKPALRPSWATPFTSSRRSRGFFRPPANGHASSMSAWARTVDRMMGRHRSNRLLTRWSPRRRTAQSWWPRRTPMGKRFTPWERSPIKALSILVG
jgi:hypothetical protein